MGKLQRVQNVLVGILTILLSIIMMLLEPEDGFLIAALILAFTLLFAGIRSLIYYFTMARHMVGGKMILYIGLIVLDFGMFTMAMTNIPHIYLILYLLGSHAFTAVIDIMRASEAKRNGASMWKLNMSTGIVNILVAILCLFALGSIRILVVMYCLGLIYSGCVRIIYAFRKTAIVYIQ